MTQFNLSITIRPTYEEFLLIHEKKVIDSLINYVIYNDGLIIVGLESGKDNKVNHYQIAVSGKIHPDVLRRKVNKFFRPFLRPSTLKIGKWKLVKLHKDIKGLVGYCVKEDNVYSTNYSLEYREQASKYYLETKNKAVNKPKKRPRCIKCDNLGPKERRIAFDYVKKNGILNDKYTLFCLKC